MYPNTFYRVSVKALIKDDVGKVLVLKENQNTWSLPGGGLDHGEDPARGVLRELREELGIESAQVGSMSCAKTFYLDQKQIWLMWIVYNVKIEAAYFTYGKGVHAATFIDVETLSTSKDIFEKMVYEAANSVN